VKKRPGGKEALLQRGQPLDDERVPQDRARQVYLRYVQQRRKAELRNLPGNKLLAAAEARSARSIRLEPDRLGQGPNGVDFALEVRRELFGRASMVVSPRSPAWRRLRAA